MNSHMYSENAAALIRCILTWGTFDVDHAATWLDEAGIEFGEFGEYLAERIRGSEMSIQSVDVCAHVLEYAANEAHVEELNVYWNCLDSGYSDDTDTIYKALRAVPEDDRNNAWRFVAEQGLGVTGSPDTGMIELPPEDE